MTNQPPLAIAAKPRTSAMAQYLMAMAVVIGAYSAYLKLAVPLIEGPPPVGGSSSVASLEPFDSPGVDKTRLIPLLPQDAWELNECKTLLTESGTVLFQRFEQIDETTIKVVPFTFITGDGMKSFGTEMDSAGSGSPPPLGSPMILRCIEGANLRFDQPTAEIFRGNAKMQSARLTGSVDIHRPATDDGKSGAIDIVTSNVQIDKHRIYTLDDVEFSFGPHRGRGRNLLIDLSHEAEYVGGADDFSTINGVRRIELAFLDRLRVEMAPNRNEWEIKSQSTGTSEMDTRLLHDNNSPLEVTCSGPFVFDFESQTASFNDDVVAQQMDTSRNHIKCDQLTLVFDTQSTPPLSDPANPKANSSLRLKQFVATGSPAVVVSNSQPARITADYLSYDLLSNQIDAHCESENERMVTIVSPEHQLVAKQLKYVIPDDGSIGTITAIGPGRLLRIASQKQDEFFLTWTQGLTCNDDPLQPGIQKITVNGNAKIRIAKETRVDADQLDLTIWKLPAAPIAGDDSHKQKWEYRPAKLVTTGSVKIDSPKIAGSADQLTAIWPNPVQQPVSQIRHGRTNSHRTDFHRVAYRGVPDDLPAGQLNPLKPAKKIHFRGQRVNIRLSANDQETQIQDLTIVGNVVVFEAPQSSTTPNAAAPTTFQITGEQLQMIPQAGQNYRVLVSGKPGALASIVGTDFELNGNKINLDQTANKLWVEGIGMMKIKTAKPSIVTQPTQFPADPASQKTPENLNVQWAGGMVFDGSTIYFEQDVVMATDQRSDDGIQTVMNTHSQQLRVELKRPVNFQGLTQGQEIGNPEIKELVFVDRVPPSKSIFKQASHTGTSKPPERPGSVIVRIQKTDAQDQPSEQIVISVPQVTVNPAQGTIEAKGPGSIATHRSGTTAPNSSFGNLTKQTSPAGLSFIQVNFDGKMIVNSKQKEMKIDGNVRTLYASVKSWNETVDPDQVTSRTQGSVQLTSEHLHLAQWKPRASENTINEIIAWGNVHVLSDAMEVIAHRLSYNQASDTITIEGTPRTHANLWYRQTPNDRNPTHLVAEKITHRMDGTNTQTDGVKSLNINGGR